MLKFNSIIEKNKCTGCGACMQKCPKACIKMEYDLEGFLVPAIETDICINCDICKKTCPQFNPVDFNSPIECYGVRNNNDDILMESSSGGMFSILAEKVINSGGYVFGCGYTKNSDGYLKAIHFCTNKIDELQKMRGSKYVQSEIGNTYLQTKMHLDKNKWVLYTGTPCQIAGLRAYLSNEYERLITVDLICHGVPSPKLFSKYIEYCGNKVNGEILNYKFRDKSQKIGMYYYYYYYKEKDTGKIKSKHGSRNRSGYFSAFSNGDTYRESCYNCPYSKSDRVADITIGDYFGINYQYPEFDTQKGVSSVLLNSEKGKDFFEKVKYKTKNIHVALNDIVKQSSNLQRPTKRTTNRDIAYTNFMGTTLEIFENKPYKVTYKAKVIAFIKENMPIAVINRIRKIFFKLKCIKSDIVRGCSDENHDFNKQCMG